VRCMVRVDCVEGRRVGSEEGRERGRFVS
jgi:hypothetical protein